MRYTKAKLIHACIVACIFAGTSVFGIAGASDYVVKPGDTLSKVIQTLIPGRIYGARGNLAQVLAQNPGLADRGDKILPGQRIVMTESATQAASITTLNTALRKPASDGTLTEAPAKSVGEKSVFELAPRFTYNRIDAVDRSTGGKASVGSDPSLGLEIAWRQIWSQKFSTFLKVAADHVDEKTMGKTLNENTFTRGSFEVGSDSELSERFHFLSALGVENSPILRGDSPTSLILDSVPILKLEAGLDYALTQSKLFGVSLGANAALRMPSSQSLYLVQTGYDYQFHLSVRQLLGKCPIHSQLFFQHSAQNTSLTTQSESILGFSLGVNFDLSPETP